MSRLNKGSKGTREKTRQDESPAPTAGPAAATATPLSQVATIESVKDVGAVSQVSYATDYGYSYHDYDMEAPNDNRVQLFARMVKYSPLGYHGKQPVGIGFERIHYFYDNLYSELLSKAVKRDGYRHLPDTMDSGLKTYAPFALWVGEVINVRTIRNLIDSPSWNDATKVMRNDLSRKNRRAIEVWNALMTFEIPDLYRMQALLHPVISDRPGGAIIITLVNNKAWFDEFGTVDATHPCCLNVVNKGGSPGANQISFSSARIDDILCEAEAAVSVLRNESFIKSLDGDSGGGLTWATGTGRGTLLDLKYYFTLINELVYPMGLPEAGQIVVDPAEFNHILYGDAIYGLYDKVTLGVHTYHSIGYPFVTGANQGLVYRRGFNTRTTIVDGGFKQIWATLLNIAEGEDMWDDQSFLGAFVHMMDNQAGGCNYCYTTWTRNEGFTHVHPSVNYDDATALRTWMEDGRPAADHQWNEMLFAKDDTLPMHGPAGLKAYGFHQPVSVPAELLRAAKCSTWNLPFVR